MTDLTDYTEALICPLYCRGRLSLSGTGSCTGCISGVGLFGVPGIHWAGSHNGNSMFSCPACLALSDWRKDQNLANSIYSLRGPWEGLWDASDHLNAWIWPPPKRWRNHPENPAADPKPKLVVAPPPRWKPGKPTFQTRQKTRQAG